MDGVLSTLRDFSIIGAAWMVIYGIDAWRREFRGKREIELAEEILALLYETRDAIRVIRSPLGYPGEGTTRSSAGDETSAEKAARDQAYTVVERYQRFQELFARLRSKRYRFTALLGPSHIRPFEELDGIISDLFLASRMLASLWTRSRAGGGHPLQLDHYEKTDKYEDVIWDSGKEDPISQRLDSAVGEMERICRGIIEGQGTIHGLLNRPIFVKRRAS